MINFFHRLFNPHCPDCIYEIQRQFERDTLLKADELSKEIELTEFNLKCNTCESLKSENVFLRQQVKDLQDHILHPSVPIEPTINTDDLKPIHAVREPFSIIRSRLEQADRQKAKLIDEQLLATAAAKVDSSPIVNDEGKVDSKLVEQELANMNQELKQHG